MAYHRSLSKSLDRVIRAAEDAALAPCPSLVGARVSEYVVNALLEVRTYIEAGQPNSAAAKEAIRNAVAAAREIAEDYAYLAPLHSATRVLQDEMSATRIETWDA